MTPVILASASTARAALLAAAGVSFQAKAPRLDEEIAKRRLEAAGVSAGELALGLAEQKALSLDAGDAVVIGADQTLSLDGDVAHKAGDLEAARQRLAALRGRPHQLHAAVVLARNGAIRWRHLATASLIMRWFSDAFLDDYLARYGGEALGAVGCYRLEDAGAQLFDSIEGDYFSILGLPLIPLLGALRREAALLV
ncbi:MAG: Maf family protein [Caulobacteraceae bacterium]